MNEQLDKAIDELHNATDYEPYMAAVCKIWDIVQIDNPNTDPILGGEA